MSLNASDKFRFVFEQKCYRELSSDYNGQPGLKVSSLSCYGSLPGPLLTQLSVFSIKAQVQVPVLLFSLKGSLFYYLFLNV
ncbi:hypothetical protein XENTR_v10011189 [Xenopus tropicalis]|nr:hypothetical protein XENTR_v10011189 [Xenopus tropicalis]